MFHISCPFSVILNGTTAKEQPKETRFDKAQNGRKLQVSAID